MLSLTPNTFGTYQTNSTDSISSINKSYQTRSKFIPKVLIQKIPLEEYDLDLPVEEYEIDALTKVTDSNALSQVDNDPQTFEVINNIPKMTNLPKFVYQRDANTGFLKRYLVTERDTSYDTDTDYGIDQRWLLNNRQGDQYDRVPERISDPVIANEENNNIFGATTLNEGRIWGGPPKLPPPYRSAYYEEYQQYLEYAQTQVEEESD